MWWVLYQLTPGSRHSWCTPYESGSNELKLTVQKDFFFTEKSSLSERNNLVLNLKLITMKKILLYLFATAMLGSFTGLLISSGSDIVSYIGAMCLFWGCMFMPMLGSAD
jgi:hypothetical protein